MSNWKLSLHEFSFFKPSNPTYRFSITGKNLLSVFEHGVSSFIEGSNEEGAFLQVTILEFLHFKTRLSRNCHQDSRDNPV